MILGLVGRRLPRGNVVAADDVRAARMAWNFVVMVRSDLGSPSRSQYRRAPLRRFKLFSSAVRSCVLGVVLSAARSSCVLGVVFLLFLERGW